jgi:hypothetical protein
MVCPLKTKKERFAIFLERLKAASPVSSRECALELMTEIIDRVEDEFSVTVRSDFSERMHVWRWEFQWKDLDSDPCYWDDSANRTHRVIIYHSGRIIIKNLKVFPTTVILDKLGTNLN